MLGSKRIIADLKYVKLVRFLAKHPQQLAALSNRQIHLDSPRLKWLTKEQAKKVHEVAVGSRAGHPDDPVVNTADKPYYGNPSKGDPIVKNFYYRDPVIPQLWIDKLLTTLLTGFFWYWVLYHLYYDYGMIFGHFYTPYLQEFTDEELGIPPDDAPDPEYWGNHGKPHGTYR